MAKKNYNKPKDSSPKTGNRRPTSSDIGNDAPVTRNRKSASFGGSRSGTRSGAVISKPCNMDSLVSNDVAYYNKLREQYDAVTQVPTWWKVYGRDSGIGKTISSSNYRDMRFPIGMAIDFVPGPGTCATQDDPANRAFAVMMADLYAKSSSSSLPFQQADLAMLTVSISSIADLIAAAKRALGFANNWVTTNMYYPIGVLKMLGFSYDDLRANRAAYIEHLNAVIARFNSLRFPDKFDVLHRQYALCHNIYVDEDSAFGQLYAFRPSGYYAYSDTDHKAKFTRIDWNAGTGFGALLDKIDGLLDTWFNSSDLYLINGALQRAYSDATFASISAYNGTETVTPVVDRIIMGQVMNMDIRGTLANCDIAQDVSKNAIIWQPYLSDSTSDEAKFNLVLAGDGVHFMRAYDESVSADDNMEFTRLCNTLYIDSADKKYHVNAATEIVERVVVYRAYGDSADTVSDVLSVYHNNILDSKTDVLTVLRWLNPFRYGPRTVLVAGDPATQTANGIAMLYDVYNYTSLSDMDLDRLNRVALFSMWYL